MDVSHNGRFLAFGFDANYYILEAATEVPDEGIVVIGELLALKLVDGDTERPVQNGFQVCQAIIFFLAQSPELRQPLSGHSGQVQHTGIELGHRLDVSYERCLRWRRRSRCRCQSRGVALLGVQYGVMPEFSPRG